MIELDVRGLRCPWPALRLARAMREGTKTVRLLADDPAAEREVAALAAERGWRFAREDAAVFRIEAKALPES